MNRLAARIHDAFEITFRRAYFHTRGEEVTGIESARGIEPEVTLLIDVTDKESDLIHVRSEHDARWSARALGSLAARRLGADEGAHRVGVGRIPQRLGFLLDERAHAILAARDARCFTETAEEFEIHEQDSL